jgi:hypothetical protein
MSKWANTDLARPKTPSLRCPHDHTPVRILDGTTASCPHCERLYTVELAEHGPRIEHGIVDRTAPGFPLVLLIDSLWGELQHIGALRNRRYANKTGQTFGKMTGKTEVPGRCANTPGPAEPVQEVRHG